MAKSKANTAVNTTAATTSTTPWEPRNNPGVSTTSEYGYFGTIGKDNKLLVYGEKPAGATRRPQSKRVVNRPTIEAILRGEIKPVPNGKHLDVHSLAEEGSPFREAYLAATGTPVGV